MCQFTAVIRLRRNRRLSVVLDLLNSEKNIISTLYGRLYCSVPSSSLCLYPHLFSLPSHQSVYHFYLNFAI
jgi:hypothetical protein